MQKINLDKCPQCRQSTRMSNTNQIEVTICGTVRVELHATPQSAKRSQIRWEQMGFSTRLYWVNENSEDTICGLEVAA